MPIQSPLVRDTWRRFCLTDWRNANWTQSCGIDLGRLFSNFRLWDRAHIIKIDDTLMSPEDSSLISWIRCHDTAMVAASPRLLEARRHGRDGLYKRTWGDLLYKICMRDITTVSLSRGYQVFHPLTDIQRQSLAAAAMRAMGFVQYAQQRDWGNPWHDHTLADYMESLMYHLGEEVHSGVDNSFVAMELLFFLSCFIYCMEYYNQQCGFIQSFQV